MSLEIARLKESAILPVRATIDAAGMDLFAAETVTLDPGQRCLIGTGIAIALQPWHVGFVCPRSGMALRDRVTVLNAPGVIDPDYRGEVGVILINLGADAFTIQRGERIAQLVLAPVTRLAWSEVDALDETSRGAGGFGSTGR